MKKIILIAILFFGISIFLSAQIFKDETIDSLKTVLVKDRESNNALNIFKSLFNVGESLSVNP